MHRTHHCRRALAALAVVLAWLVVSALPASAHTDLASSTPAQGARLDAAPATATLTFSEAVDAETIEVHLVDATGGEVPGLHVVAGAEPTGILVHLPGLDEGAYGLQWSTVGDDGHQASGELSFQVGETTRAIVAAAGNHPIDGLGTAGRLLWYAGAALLAGALWLAAIGTPVPEWVRRAASLAFAGTVIRWLDVVLPQRGDTLDAVASRPSTLLLLAGVALVALLLTTPPLTVSVGLALAAAWLGTAVGHGDSLLQWVHLVVASLWIGPLVLVVVLRLGRDVLRRFTPVALWSFPVLAITGFSLGWSGAGGRPLNDYSTVLLAKVALVVAVVVPLGWLHHVRVRQALTPSLRTLRLETLALGVVLVLAAILSGLDPTEAPSAADAQATSAAGDPTACAALEVGRPACYEAWFLDVLDRDGPEAAIGEIEALSATDDEVLSQCHQLTHAVGQAAGEQFATLSEALSFDASTCWSGYYHGVVEGSLADYSDADLPGAVPGLCAEAATERYSFTHYNCLHGLGHGLMLRSGSDPFASLDLCTGLSDEWEQGTCAGGVFMQDVITAQEGGRSSFRDDDQLYPCTAVDEGYKDDCYRMQTSSVLWRNDYDFAGAAGVCDVAEAGYVDDCYRSLGRDASGYHLLDAVKVAETCALGDEDHQADCIAGASANAVYDRHDRSAADDLCAVVGTRLVEACTTARDEALATF